MKDFFQLKKNLKKDISALMPIKAALMGDTTTQFLAEAIKGSAIDAGINLILWEAEYNLINQLVFEAKSDLYTHKPELVIIFFSTHKLLSAYNKMEVHLRTDFASDKMKEINRFYEALSHFLPDAKIIFYNFFEINDSLYGNYANKREEAFLYQLRKLNYELMLFSTEKPSFFICDLASIQAQNKSFDFFQPALYIHSDITLSLDILPLVAKHTTDMINAFYGKIKKCIILDLDNTLWGGIIGEDGITHIQLGSFGIGKAFTEFQQWLKKLSQRGVILAVCSKNYEETAKEPFLSHPEMVLKLEDIAVFIANWNNKADNIREIQKTLSIGWDAMVFIDDSAFERHMVREFLPEVCVPEMPEDPALYLDYLYSLNLFETASYAKEDVKRTQLYQTDIIRNQHKQNFANEEDFLCSLNMTSLVEPFNAFNAPRIAQLSQRSNQFNLRTLRYSESDILKMAESDGYFTFSFNLKDIYGDNGLINVIILKKENTDTLFIDTWFMSCRVLKRSMENFALNCIVDFAIQKGYKIIKGEYIPTAKNAIVQEHYKNLGFHESNNFWILDIKNYEKRKCFIEIEN